MLLIALCGHQILTISSLSVRLVRRHGKHHVCCGKRGEEVQEVHEEQMRVLLEWCTVDNQGEGAPEGHSAEATHPDHRDQDDSPLKGD